MYGEEAKVYTAQYLFQSLGGLELTYIGRMVVHLALSLH